MNIETATTPSNTPESFSVKESIAPTELSATVPQPQTAAAMEVGNQTSGLYDLENTLPRNDERWLSSFFPKFEKKTGSLVMGTDGDGKMWVKTADDYLIRFQNRDQKWTITGPDGRTTTIWGDPHVIESDGDLWDFKDNSTFSFGNNKITVETVPGPNGMTYTGTVHIYSGKERISLSGIDKNAINFNAWEHDGKDHDNALADGGRYRLQLESNGEDAWVRQKS